jgi:hypothetical protein
MNLNAGNINYMTLKAAGIIKQLEEKGTISVPGH